MQLLGILPDVLQQGQLVPTMRTYRLPGGIEPLATWQFVERVQATPSAPWVSGCYYSNYIN
jgi:hypothetical protein